ncbi:YebC-like protein, partial [Coprinopsis marcescibilis]
QWSKIKDRKGANDTQKSILYGTASRDIIVAARSGGSPDPNLNAQLAAVLKKYKDQGIPRENIDKALNKAGAGKEKAGESVTYEALAFGSVGIVVECLTDNATRTLHNIRHALTRNEARMTPVKFMFQRKGCVKVSLDKSLADHEKQVEDLIEAALAADAEDFDQRDDEENPKTLVLKFVCPPEALSVVTLALVSSSTPSLKLQSSELIYAPAEEAEEPSEELGSKMAALVEELQADEDTLRVWTSLDSW